MAATWASNVVIDLKHIRPVGKEIGRGAYGRVFEVEYEGTFCAAKEIHGSLLDFAAQCDGDQIENLKANFLLECQIWSTLRHPNIVQFLGVYYPESDQHGMPVIVMEKMLYSLRSFVEKCNNIPLSVTLSILDDVTLGLRYLHTRTPPIIHRDLTPNNILLNHSLEAKITDLGVAKAIQTANSRSLQTMTRVPGTPNFMPPECTYGRPVYGLPIDVFSFGGVVIFVTTQEWPEPAPLMQHDDSGVKYLSEVERRQQYLDKMTDSAAELKPIVISCLNGIPNNRPPIEEVSMRIKSLKGETSREDSIVWWAKVLSKEEEQKESHQQTYQTEVTSASVKVQTEKNQGMISKSNQTEVTYASVEVQTAEKNQGMISKEAPSLVPALKSGRYKIKWTKLADLPVPLSGIYAAANDMKVYVTGCLSPNEDSYHEVYVYDCASNHWDKLPQSGHYYGVPHVVGGKLVLIGGRLSATKERTNKVSTFDQSDQCWVKHHPDMLSAKSRPGVVSYLEYVIVLGGGVEDKENIALDTIEILNYIENLQWIEVSLHLPIPMWRITPTIVDDQLYIINYNYKKPMQEAYTIPVASLLDSNGSSQFTKLAPPITFAAAVLTDFPTVLVCGGTNKEISTNDMFMYDTITKSWKNVTGNLSESRSFAAATAVTSNAIITIGGYCYCENSDDCLSTVELGQAELITIK